MSETYFYDDPEEWAFAVAEHTIGQGDVGNTKEIGISDIDDTLIDSSLRWYEDYKRLAAEKGLDDLQVVTLREFKERGYRRCTMELGLVEDYDEYKLLRMHSLEFHMGMAAVQGTEALSMFSNSLPGGYITTRPAVLGEVTYQNLRQHSFRHAPLLLRPSHVPYEKTIPFKIDALVTLRSVLDETNLLDVGVHYIDDYVGVIDGINELGHRALAGIHFDAHNSWESIAQKFVAGSAAVGDHLNADISLEVQ